MAPIPHRDKALKLALVGGFRENETVSGGRGESMGEAGMEARYLTDDSGGRVGVVLGAEEYRAIMEVYDLVAKA